MRAIDTPAAGFQKYSLRLATVLAGTDWTELEGLAQAMRDCWRDDRQVFVCGNGGSAANALHIANDMFYGVSRRRGPGLRIHALPANASVLTCLANDEGYDEVFSLQLTTLGRPGDILIALSGSGNSPNILAALREARRIGMQSWAVLGFSGGAAKQLADHPLHFAIDDMQIAEDLQLILGHMIMQWLSVSGQGENR